MAEEFLDEIDDDLDDVMEDILDASIEDLSEDTFIEALDLDESESGDEEKESLSGRLIQSVKGILKKAFSSTKRIIITAAGILLLIIVIVAAVFFFTGGGEEAEQGSTVSSGEEIPEPEIIFEDIVDLEPFERISMKSSSSMGLISLSVSLELSDHRYRKQIYSMEERIRTIISAQVAGKTWLELRTPEGKILLKYTLLKQINEIFPKPTVRNIYFTSLVMQ